MVFAPCSPQKELILINLIMEADFKIFVNKCTANESIVNRLCSKKRMD